MIKLTHLKRNPFYLNSDLIAFVEETPDTLVILTSGEKLIVEETPEQVIDRMVAFKQRVFGRDTYLHIMHHTPPADMTPGEE